MGQYGRLLYSRLLTRKTPFVDPGVGPVKLAEQVLDVNLRSRATLIMWTHGAQRGTHRPQVRRRDARVDPRGRRRIYDSPCTRRFVLEGGGSVILIDVLWHIHLQGALESRCCGVALATLANHGVVLDARLHNLGESPHALDEVTFISPVLLA